MSIKLYGLKEKIQALEKYKRSMKMKIAEFNGKLAEVGVHVAKIEYHKAQFEDWAGNDQIFVTYDLNTDKGTAIIRAWGPDAIFAEFGTGVTKADSPESRELWGENPDLKPHGGYGKGHGANPDGWDFRGELKLGKQPAEGTYQIGNGWVHTKGADAHPGMYLAHKEIVENVKRIAEEVFLND